MRKSLIIAAASTLFASANAFSAAFSLTSVDPTNGQYSAIIDVSNALLPAGTGFVGVGMFSADPAVLGAAGPNQLLLDAFTAYASSTFGGANVGDADGSVFASSNAIIPDSFNNQQVYVVFGNAATFSSSTQVAVVNAGRVFTDDDPMNPVPMPFDFNLGAFLAAGVVANNGILTNNTAIPALDGQGAVQGPNGLQLVAVVPEPSVGILAALVGVVFFVRRRR